MIWFDKRAEAEKLADDAEIAEEIASTDLPTDVKVEILEDAGVDEEIIDEVIDAEATDAVAAYYGVNPYWLHDKRASMESDAAGAEDVSDEEIAAEVAETDLPTDVKVELLEDAGVDPDIIEDVIDADATDVVASYYGVDPYWLHDKRASWFGSDEEAEEVPEGVDPSLWEQVKAWLTQQGIDAKEWLADPENQKLLLTGGIGALLGGGLGYALGGGTGALLGSLTGAGLGYAAGMPQVSSQLPFIGTPGAADAGAMGYTPNFGPNPYPMGPGPMPLVADQIASIKESAWLMDKLAADDQPKKGMSAKQRQTLTGAGVGGLGGALLGGALGGGKGAVLGGLAGMGLGGAGGYNFDRIQNLINKQDAQPGAEINKTTEAKKAPAKGAKK